MPGNTTGTPVPKPSKGQPDEYISAIAEHFKKYFSNVLKSEGSSVSLLNKSFAQEVANLRKEQLLCELNEENVVTHLNNMTETLHAKHIPYDELQNLTNELSKDNDGSIVFYVSSKLYQKFADIISEHTTNPPQNKKFFKQIKLNRLLNQARNIFGEHALEDIMHEIGKMNEDEFDTKIEYVTGEIENANKNIDLIGKAAWDEIKQITDSGERQEKLELRIAEATEAIQLLGNAEWKKIRSIANLTERDKALQNATAKHCTLIKKNNFSNLHTRSTTPIQECLKPSNTSFKTPITTHINAFFKVLKTAISKNPENLLESLKTTAIFKRLKSKNSTVTGPLFQSCNNLANSLSKRQDPQHIHNFTQELSQPLKLCLTNGTDETNTHIEQAVNQNLLQLRKELTNPDTPATQNDKTSTSQPAPKIQDTDETNKSKQEPNISITKQETNQTSQTISLNTKRHHILKTNKNTKELRKTNLMNALNNYNSKLTDATNSIPQQTTAKTGESKGSNTPINLLTAFQKALKENGITISNLSTNTSTIPNWLGKTSKTTSSDLKNIKKATKNIPDELKNSETTLYIC